MKPDIISIIKKKEEDLETEEQILRFINGFESVKDFFLNGYCYWFAVILAKRFNGEIWYYPIENHFITVINNKGYDASGEYEIHQPTYPWGTYYKVDSLDCMRVVRDCINKEEY